MVIDSQIYSLPGDEKLSLIHCAFMASLAWPDPRHTAPFKLICKHLGHDNENQYLYFNTLFTRNNPDYNPRTIKN